MYDTDKKAENKKLLLRASIVLGILILLVIVGAVAHNIGSGENTSETKTEGSLYEDETEDLAYSVAYPGVDGIREKMFEGAASAMMSGTQNAILMGDEIAAAVKANRPKTGYAETVFTVLADLNSFTEKLASPYFVYSMKFEVSDGRNYASTTAFSDEDSYATLVQRVAPSKGQIYLYITVDTLNSERDEVINRFINWAKNTYPGEKIAVTTN